MEWEEGIQWGRSFTLPPQLAMHRMLIVFVGATARIDLEFGEGSSYSPVLLDNVRCAGMESRLIDCASRGLGVQNSCTHRQDAGVTCVASM